ncbi:MAG: hypothetical protein ABIO92_03810 [Chloroflexia bacterium]
MNDLAGFSEWTLALLPRLFLYPGGLWLLAVLVGLRFIVAGRRAASPHALQPDLLRADLPSMATAWVAVALLPLPGENSLPFPTDRLALVGLLAISLAFDRLRELRITTEPPRRQEHQETAKSFIVLNYERFVEIAILTAVIVPIAGLSTLLDANGGLSGWLSLLAVLLGMITLARQAANDLTLAVRLVGWLGLAAAPILAYNWSLVTGHWSLAVYTALIIAVGIAGRRVAASRIKLDWSMVAVWSLASLSLLAALLGPA